MSQNNYDNVPRWYVVHTYSGYENKVKTDLEKTIKNRELEDYFFDIVGATGFVGSGTEPIPLTDEELRKMGFEDVPIKVDYSVNDNVQILGGPLDGYTGVVQEINKEKNKVRVLVSMFGRETPVELEFSQVQKIS